MGCWRWMCRFPDVRIFCEPLSSSSRPAAPLHHSPSHTHRQMSLKVGKLSPDSNLSCLSDLIGDWRPEDCLFVFDFDMTLSFLPIITYAVSPIDCNNCFLTTVCKEQRQESLYDPSEPNYEEDLKRKALWNSWWVFRV